MKRYLIQNGTSEIAVVSNIVTAVFKENEIMRKNLTTNIYHDLFNIIELNKDGSTSPLPLYKIINAKTKLLKFERVAQIIEPKMRENRQPQEDRIAMVTEMLISYLS